MSKIYLNFPISMIPPIYVSIYDGFNDIIDYGIYKYTKRRGLTLEEAAEEMGIILRQKDIKHYEDIFSREADCNVFTAIGKVPAFKYRDSGKNMEQDRDEILAVACALAVRSIIGVKEYALCHKRLVLSRMSGIAKAVDAELYNDAIKPLVEEGQRRQWRKAIQSLSHYGCSVYVPQGCHGFYASYRLKPIQLATKVEGMLARNRGVVNEYHLSNEQLRKIALKKIASPLKDKCPP